MNDEALKIEKKLKETYKNEPILFLKFNNNIERLKQIQNGSLFMNNFQFFIDEEEKYGNVGMGDRAEASLVMYEADVSIFHLDSDELIAKAPVDSVFIRDDRAVQSPLFCLFAITIDMFEVAKIKEDRVTFRLKKFSQEQLANMKADFGEHVLIIKAMPFLFKVRKAFQKKGYKYASGFAQYVDYSILDAKRSKHHEERNERMFFYKDKKFEHQKEYRLVILNKKITVGAPEEIGSIEAYSTIQHISFLENDKTSIKINNVKYK